MFTKYCSAPQTIGELVPCCRDALIVIEDDIPLCRKHSRMFQEGNLVFEVKTKEKEMADWLKYRKQSGLPIDDEITKNYLNRMGKWRD